MNLTKDQNKTKQENPWISLIVNLIAPTVILGKPEYLGPELTLVAALAFPLTYGIWDFYQRRKVNFISGLGFASVLIKGGLGLLKTDNFWFAVNEAALPAIIGVAILLTARSKRPLVKAFLMNDSVMHVERINHALTINQCEKEFSELMRRSTYLMFISFFISAVLNFILAQVILKSPVGTDEFSRELSRMQLVSFPVIMVSCSSIMVYALWKLVKELQRMTGLEFEEIFRTKG